MKVAFKETFIVDEKGRKRGVIINMESYRRLQKVLQSIDVNQLWFWFQEWQKKERRADQAIKKGSVKRFDHVEDLIRELKR